MHVAVPVYYLFPIVVSPSSVEQRRFYLFVRPMLTLRERIRKLSVLERPIGQRPRRDTHTLRNLRPYLSLSR